MDRYFWESSGESKLEQERMRKNNKVGIITLYHDNYNFGGLLQAYALPTALKKYFDLDAEQIDYDMSPEKEDLEGK